MEFIQSAPYLANQYSTDRVLRSWLAYTLPSAVRGAIEADLEALGAHAANAWIEARTRTVCEPVLTQWDAWGRRIDHIESTPVWQQGTAMTARYGLVAAGHDSTHGEYARCDQFARVYLHHIASEFYTCPLAMTDGAATALKASGNAALIERAVPHLTTREPSQIWLSGQWMTENIGGSDVGNSETTARRDSQGNWRLYGRKWFTSAVIGQMALTLARPSGVPGSNGLAMFYLETHDAAGNWNGIRVDRLKNKLGTRELATAEIHLDGALATPVGGLDHGVRMIAPMLNVTRTWNSVCALATMRRCIALATAYAHQRQAFGKPLMAHALHVATLADMQARFEAAFQLVFHVAHLLGRSEHGTADANERALLRILTPLLKLWTARLAVGIASETCEAFGGAGYIENTGIPQLLRDAQVYPIWEGTTNVLAIDSLRAIDSTGLEPLVETAETLLANAEAGMTSDDSGAIRFALASASAWLQQTSSNPMARLAGARAFAFTLARSFAAALLCRHASHAQAVDGDPRPGIALSRFIAQGLIEPAARDDAAALDLLDPSFS